MAVAVVGVVVLACLSILLYYARTGAPPVSATNVEVGDVVALLRAAELPRRAVIYELGCGWGTLAVALARAFPMASVIAVELSPLPWLVAAWRARRLNNLEVRRTDFHAVTLSDADAVTCYLMMAPMVELADTLDRELGPGTAVVALTFWFRDRLPAKTRRGPGLRGDVALYHWPARRPAA
jgi:precorrin-6B methylase 2